MSCIGEDCKIIKQEARSPLIRSTSFSGKCSPDQVGNLYDKARQKIIEDATKTADTCASGCKCEPLVGARSEETEWSATPVDPFTLKDGDCEFTVNEATVETRIVRTPGLCKEAKIHVSSTAYLAGGTQLLVDDASVLTSANLLRIQEVLGGKA
jgi:hypothetical protein